MVILMAFCAGIQTLSSTTYGHSFALNRVKIMKRSKRVRTNEEKGFKEDGIF